MKSSGRKFIVLGLITGIGLAGCDDDGVGPGNGGADLRSPSGVEVQAVSPTSARVTWETVAGATAYEIERAEGASGGSFSPAGTASAPPYEVTGLNTGATYRFRVTAVGGNERSQPSNPSAAFTVPDEVFSVLTSDITSDRTLYADSTYVLSGFIKVANGATLTIEPGTKIVGDYEIPGSSLFILRGSKIMAEGTPEQPIVFTSERPVGQRQPGDWGGLILIGNGIINRSGPTTIEGTGTPSDINPLQFYEGGTDNDDSSGVLRYVRIEFAGYPTAPNEELNSLTMAAVGSGTTLEYVQVLQGLDDSFEWFGGAVNGRYLISYESGDDHFDASEGFIGRNQYMIAFQSIRPEPRPGLSGGVASDPQGIENDGCWAENCAAGDNNRSASQPYTIPVFANFTLVGAPEGVWETSGGNYGMMLRRGTGGLYVNGVVTRYSKSAISLRGEQTMDRHEQGNLRIQNLFVSQTDGVFQPVNDASGESRQYALDLVEHALEAASTAPASLFSTFPAETLGASAESFDWRPASGSPIATGGLTDFGGLPSQLAASTVDNGSPNSAVAPTSYRGAADPDGPAWWAGWTNYARN